MKKRRLIILFLIAMALQLFTNCNMDNTDKSVVVDHDGNTYKTVTIGEQVWMTENFKATKDKYGNEISIISGDSVWASLGDNNNEKAYCYYNNDESSEFGALYTYAAAKDVCPVGWHLPTDSEWTKLENYLSADGFEGSEYIALKATFGWNDYTGKNGNGTDDYGFSALAGGFRISSNGAFVNANHTGAWWTSTESGSSKAYLRGLHSDFPGLYRIYVDKSEGLFVRCIQD